MDEIEKNKKYYNFEDLFSMPDKDIEWFAKGFLVRKGITMLLGDSNSTKTLITILIILELFSKEKVFNKFKVMEKPRVLFLDLESHPENISRRLKLLAKGNDILFKDIIADEKENKNFFFYSNKHFCLTNDDDLKELIDLIKEKNINFIILDSLVRFAGIDENNSQESNKLFSKLKLIVNENCSLFIIHHKNKTGQIRGSSDFRASLDALYVLDRIDKNFMLHQNSEAGGKSKEFVEIDEIMYTLNAIKEDEITKALNINFLNIDVQNKQNNEEKVKKGDFKPNPYDPKLFDNKVVNKMVFELKEILNSYGKDKTISSKEMMEELEKKFKNYPIVYNNFYSKHGALNKLKNENKLKKGKKKGSYIII